jgi:hypothetical protein
MPLVFNQLLKYKLAREKVLEKLQLEHKRYITPHQACTTKSTVYKRHVYIKTAEQ